MIWDADSSRGEAMAGQFNSRFEADLGTVLDDAHVDAFLICAENTRHLELMEQVMPIGKPVMCEKPLATTLSDAKRIRELCTQYGTPLISGYFQPFAPGNRAVRHALANGQLGSVTHATFRNAHSAAYGRWFDSPALAWFTQPELSGGGALLDMGTHAVHLLRHLFGPVESVWAMTGNYAGTYPDVDDYGLLVMRFACGILGRVEAGWVFTGGYGGLEVIGSEKSIWGGRMSAPKADPEDLPAADARPDRTDRLIALVRGELDASELAEDLDACLDSVAIMVAAYRSAESGTWETVASI